MLVSCLELKDTCPRETRLFALLECESDLGIGVFQCEMLRLEGMSGPCMSRSACRLGDGGVFRKPNPGCGIASRHGGRSRL